MKVIREYVNEMEALVARSVLEAHHIPAVVLRDDAGGVIRTDGYFGPDRRRKQLPGYVGPLRRKADQDNVLYISE